MIKDEKEGNLAGEILQVFVSDLLTNSFATIPQLLHEGGLSKSQSQDWQKNKKTNKKKRKVKFA